ncbi:hypothetical protein OIE66_35270 [Nonomuraea sp. NBC_01738]|uniref:hypothetical protein n=1 Tax=Nonomuraea sp. NBC_01738 TaxID=2976003 RepID=UPI002E0E3365|nr:hypothetical protein OIE66_35270 [Nonomuraea sp. NBC_01738]
MKLTMAAGLLAVLVAGCGAAGPAARPAAPQPWTPGTIEAPIRYAELDNGRWTLSAFTAKQAKVDATGNASGDERGWRYDLPVTDAGGWVPLTGTAQVRLSPALSADGHRLAYYSTAQRRFVARDLRTGVTRTLSPVVDATARDISDPPRVSPGGELFAVPYGNEILLTDFRTGRTRSLPGFRSLLGLTDTSIIASPEAIDDDEPANAAVITLSLSGQERSRVTVDAAHLGAISPDGRHMASTSGDRLRLTTLATGDQTAEVRLRPLAEPVAATVEHWLSPTKVLVNATTPDTDEFVGHFALDIATGKGERVKNLPQDDDGLAFGALG